jgi:hypothetical protein
MITLARITTLTAFAFAIALANASTTKADELDRNYLGYW